LAESAPLTGPTARTTELTTEAQAARLRAELSADPDNAGLYAALGLTLLQQVRETADPALYGQAEMALDETLRLDPQQLDGLIGQGQLALARHDFQAALEWGQQARAIMPYRAGALAVIVDAQIELGRYDEAIESAQAMVDLRPDLASYSRVSYVRELHGDTPGAIAAMQAAAEAGPPGAEATAWTTVQLGHLYFHSGDLASAEAAYAQALAQRPDYPYAQAGLARVQAARGEFRPAIDALEGIVARLPQPEFLNTLGQLYTVTGDAAKAEQQYDLLRAIQQLNAGSGMNVDLELALFEANHGDPAAALAMAQRAYEQRPSIYAADALAWAAYRAGDYAIAAEKMAEALRLNTQDALLFYHAGLIAAARGETQDALTYLDKALNLNPAFDFAAAREAMATATALRGQLEQSGE
jgi:tetratricopeptide (TPR) repeat protein